MGCLAHMREEKERELEERRVKEKREKIDREEKPEFAKLVTPKTERRPSLPSILPKVIFDTPPPLKALSLNTTVEIKREREEAEISIFDLSVQSPSPVKLKDLVDDIKMPVSGLFVPPTSLPSMGVEDSLKTSLRKLEDEIKIDEKAETETPTVKLPSLETEPQTIREIVKIEDTVEISIPAETVAAATRVEEVKDGFGRLLEQAEINLLKVSKGSGSLLGGGAIVVIPQYPDKRRCSDLVQEVCRRLTREKGRSTYDVKIISTVEEMEKYNVYDYCVFVLKNARSKDIEDIRVVKKIQEFKRNCPSYLIIESPESERVYSKILEIKDKFFDNVLLLTLADLKLETFESEIAPLLFGYLTFGEGFRSKPIFESVGEVLGAASQQYYREMRRFKEEMAFKPQYPDVRGSKFGEESEEHYLIKHFVVKSLIDGGVPKEGVETEVDLGGVIPDIYVKPENLAIEVETLFGKGPHPIDKLRDEILDYPQNLNLWIVMENFTMYLHLKEVFRLRNKFRREGRSVEFYTLDLRNERLVPIEEFAKDILRAFRVVVD